jgi:glyoxylase-like metal-dependent hydrolase (beta-lactamase superfamily II)
VKTSQPWFEVYKVDPGIYVIYEPYQFEEAISYLVLGEERAALIDTGNGIGDIKALTEELTDLPVMVVNTHSHSDHTGGNWEFDEVALYDHPFARERLRGRTHEEMGNFLGEGMIWKPLPDGVDPETFHSRGFEASTWLRDGDEVDLGGKRLRVVHTPGHTPDGVSLLEPRERLLFTGDIFYLAPIYIYAPGTSLDEFISSFRKMVSLDYDWATPAHNEAKVEKQAVKGVLDAAESIRSGTAGAFKPGVANGVKVRRYDYGRFALIVRAP